MTDRHPEPIDLIEDNGVYRAKLQHEVEKLTAASAKPAPSYSWVAAVICFFVSAYLGAGFVEAVLVALVGAYVQYVMVTALRGNR